MKIFKIKPNSKFSAFADLLTGKITVVNNYDSANARANGVEPATYDNMGNLLLKGEKLKSEFGG